MARSGPGGRSRLARWSRWVGGRVPVVAALVALVASVGVAGAQPATAMVLWLQVDAGGKHTCGIAGTSASTKMGTLWCWGDNTHGQLGLGHRNSRSRPTQVGRDTDWIMVTAGEAHTCALKGAQRIRYCWGNNLAGQLGLGTSGEKNSRHLMYLSPVAAGDVVEWRSLFAGADATCGIARMLSFAGLLTCWGNNRQDKLGVDPPGHPVTTPRPIAGGGKWTEVSVGLGFICGLRGDKRYCWGKNDFAQLGLGRLSTWDSPVTVPTAVPGDGAWSTVATGFRHGCGISVNRRAYCWGDARYGMVGLGKSGPGDGCCVLAPETRLPGTSWAEIYIGSESNCGLTTDGTRLCWGWNGEGQLGLGDTKTRYSPAEAEEGPVWASLTLGNTHGCGLRKSNALLCWGSNDSGQLGSPHVSVGEVSTLPVPVG